jgi:hypothetical protein
MSDDLLGALKGGTVAITPSSRDALHKYVEDRVATAHAPTVQASSEIAKEESLCEYEEELHSPNGAGCKVLVAKYRTLAAREAAAAEAERKKQEAKEEAARRRCDALQAARERCCKGCEARFPFNGDTDQDDRENSCEERCLDAIPVGDCP